MDRVRVAAIGLGWVTTHRHLPTMEASGRFDVVGVIDRQPGRAREVALGRGYRRHAEVTLDRVPWLDEVEAITIGSSPFSHYELVRAALLAGKHVLTEKPFTLTLEEGEELVALARDRRLVLSVVHNFQFARSTRECLRDRDSGRLGNVNGIMAVQLGNPRRRLPVWYDDLPLGLFYDESPHFFYLLERLAPGPLRFVRADVHPSTKGLKTPAAIVVQYECRPADRPSIPVTMQLNFESPVSEWHMALLGDEALADVDIFRDIYVRLPNDGTHTTSTVLRTSLATTWQHWFQHLTSGSRHLAGTLRYGNEEVFERFARAVRTGSEPEGIGAESALRVLRRQHEVLQNRRIIE